MSVGRTPARAALSVRTRMVNPSTHGMRRRQPAIIAASHRTCGGPKMLALHMCRCWLVPNLSATTP
eukprot:7238960-Karenia_brevis.AAC.1